MSRWAVSENARVQGVAVEWGHPQRGVPQGLVEDASRRRDDRDSPLHHLEGWVAEALQKRRRGPVEPLVQRGLLEPQPDSHGAWLVVPFSAKGRITGSIALRAEAGRYNQSSLLLLEGLVGEASIALESARLVDLHDDGRRT